MKHHFKEFDGSDYKSAVTFLAKMFQQATTRKIAFHDTCALNRENIQNVFENIKENIFTRSIADSKL